MDIERLRKAVIDKRFILSANPDWREGRACGLSDDKTEQKANEALTIILDNIAELVVAYLIAARQSVKSEEVAEAIEWMREELVCAEYDQHDHKAFCIDLAITALQAYQPWVSVSDRLPEEGAIVMVAYGEAIYFASIQYWGIHGKEVPVWRVGMGHRIEKDFSETHWKPYPETPKGETP